MLLPRFDVQMMLAEIRRQPPTFLPAVPTVYQRLATAASEQGVSLRSIRFAISGAMALPPEVDRPLGARHRRACWRRATG